ncbi:DUF4942 domain-containing protein, partial [Escherichia coli]
CPFWCENLKETTCWVERTIQMVNYRLISLALTSSLDRTIEEGRKEIDRKTWKRLFEETGMDRYWNHKQKEAFNESLRTDPPVASLEIVKGTLQHALANRRDTLAEGFVDVLNKLDRSFKSNARQYTMPKKLVLRGIFPGVNVLRYNGFSQDNHFCLRDFENIVCICSDTPTPATGGGLSMVDRLTAMRNTEFTGEVSDENGWRCRLFENGNVHICIDSISLLNALNDLISIYFANQLPAAGKK